VGWFRAGSSQALEGSAFRATRERMAAMRFHERCAAR